MHKIPTVLCSRRTCHSSSIVTRTKMSCLLDLGGDPRTYLLALYVTFGLVIEQLPFWTSTLQSLSLRSTSRSSDFKPVPLSQGFALGWMPIEGPVMCFRPSACSWKLTPNLFSTPADGLQTRQRYDYVEH